MWPLFLICPPVYMALEHAAAVRHELVLGDANDLAMRAVYPIETSPLRKKRKDSHRGGKED